MNAYIRDLRGAIVRNLAVGVFALVIAPSVAAQAFLAGPADGEYRIRVNPRYAGFPVVPAGGSIRRVCESIVAKEPLSLAFLEVGSSRDLSGEWSAGTPRGALELFLASAGLILREVKGILVVGRPDQMRTLSVEIAFRGRDADAELIRSASSRQIALCQPRLMVYLEVIPAGSSRSEFLLASQFDGGCTGRAYPVVVQGMTQKAGTTNPEPAWTRELDGWPQAVNGDFDGDGVEDFISVSEEPGRDRDVIFAGATGKTLLATNVPFYCEVREGRVLRVVGDSTRPRVQKHFDGGTGTFVRTDQKATSATRSERDLLEVREGGELRLYATEARQSSAAKVIVLRGGGPSESDSDRGAFRVVARSEPAPE